MMKTHDTTSLNNRQINERANPRALQSGGTGRKRCMVQALHGSSAAWFKHCMVQAR